MHAPRATPEATRRHAEDRAARWGYHARWRSECPLDGLTLPRLAVEFGAADLPEVAEALPRLLEMGLNHLVWRLDGPDSPDLCQAPAFAALAAAGPGARAATALCLALPAAGARAVEGMEWVGGAGTEADRAGGAEDPAGPAALAARAASAAGVAAWDRVLYRPAPGLGAEGLGAARAAVAALRAAGHEPWVEFGAALPDPDWSAWLAAADSPRAFRLPFHFADFRGFLRRRLDLGAGPEAPAKALAARGAPLAFHSPFGAPAAGSWGAPLLVEGTRANRDFAAAAAECLARLAALEGRLDREVGRLRGAGAPPAGLAARLEALAARDLEPADWEGAVGGELFPPFRHRVRQWTLALDPAGRDALRFAVEALVEAVVEFTGLHAEALRQRRQAALRPALRAVDAALPDWADGLSYAAKFLLLLASTPWPESVAFPWRGLDGAVEAAGLMRRPPLDNSGAALRAVAELWRPGA